MPPKPNTKKLMAATISYRVDANLVPDLTKPAQDAVNDEGILQDSYEGTGPTKKLTQRSIAGYCTTLLGDEAKNALVIASQLPYHTTQSADSNNVRIIGLSDNNAEAFKEIFRALGEGKTIIDSVKQQPSATAAAAVTARQTTESSLYEMLLKKFPLASSEKNTPRSKLLWFVQWINNECEGDVANVTEEKLKAALAPGNMLGSGKGILASKGFKEGDELIAAFRAGLAVTMERRKKNDAILAITAALSQLNIALTELTKLNLNAATTTEDKINGVLKLKTAMADAQTKKTAAYDLNLEEAVNIIIATQFSTTQVASSSQGVTPGVASAHPRAPTTTETAASQSPSVNIFSAAKTAIETASTEIINAAVKNATDETQKIMLTKSLKEFNMQKEAATKAIAEAHAAEKKLNFAYSSETKQILETANRTITNAKPPMPPVSQPPTLKPTPEEMERIRDLFKELDEQVKKLINTYYDKNSTNEYQFKANIDVAKLRSVTTVRKRLEKSKYLFKINRIEDYKALEIELNLIKSSADKLLLNIVVPPLVEPAQPPVASTSTPSSPRTALSKPPPVKENPAITKSNLIKKIAAELAAAEKKVGALNSTSLSYAEKSRFDVRIKELHTSIRTMRTAFTRASNDTSPQNSIATLEKLDPQKIINAAIQLAGELALQINAGIQKIESELTSAKESLARLVSQLDPQASSKEFAVQKKAVTTAIELVRDKAATLQMRTGSPPRDAASSIQAAEDAIKSAESKHDKLSQFIQLINTQYAGDITKAPEAELKDPDLAPLIARMKQEDSIRKLEGKIKKLNEEKNRIEKISADAIAKGNALSEADAQKAISETNHSKFKLGQSILELNKYLNGLQATKELHDQVELRIKPISDALDNHDGRKYLELHIAKLNLVKEVRALIIRVQSLLEVVLAKERTLGGQSAVQIEKDALAMHLSSLESKSFIELNSVKAAIETISDKLSGIDKQLAVKITLSNDAAARDLASAFDEAAKKVIAEEQEASHHLQLDIAASEEQIVKDKPKKELLEDIDELLKQIEILKRIQRTLLPDKELVEKISAFTNELTTIKTSEPKNIEDAQKRADEIAVLIVEAENAYLAKAKSLESEIRNFKDNISLNISAATENIDKIEFLVEYLENTKDPTASLYRDRLKKLRDDLADLENTPIRPNLLLDVTRVLYQDRDKSLTNLLTSTKTLTTEVSESIQLAHEEPHDQLFINEREVRLAISNEENKEHKKLFSDFVKNKGAIEAQDKTRAGIDAAVKKVIDELDALKKLIEPDNFMNSSIKELNNLIEKITNNVDFKAALDTAKKLIIALNSSLLSQGFSVPDYNREALSKLDQLEAAANKISAIELIKRKVELITVEKKKARIAITGVLEKLNDIEKKLLALGISNHSNIHEIRSQLRNLLEEIGIGANPSFERLQDIINDETPSLNEEADEIFSLIEQLSAIQGERKSAIDTAEGEKLEISKEWQKGLDILDATMKAEQLKQQKEELDRLQEITDLRDAILAMQGKKIADINSLLSNHAIFADALSYEEEPRLFMGPLYDLEMLYEQLADVTEINPNEIADNVILSRETNEISSLNALIAAAKPTARAAIDAIELFEEQLEEILPAWFTRPAPPATVSLHTLTQNLSMPLAPAVNASIIELRTYLAALKTVTEDANKLTGAIEAAKQAHEKAILDANTAIKTEKDECLRLFRKPNLDQPGKTKLTDDAVKLRRDLNAFYLACEKIYGDLIEQRRAHNLLISNPNTPTSDIIAITAIHNTNIDPITGAAVKFNEAITTALEFLAQRDRVIALQKELHTITRGWNDSTIAPHANEAQLKINDASKSFESTNANDPLSADLSAQVPKSAADLTALTAKVNAAEDAINVAETAAWESARKEKEETQQAINTLLEEIGELSLNIENSIIYKSLKLQHDSLLNVSNRSIQDTRKNVLDLRNLLADTHTLHDQIVNETKDLLAQKNESAKDLHAHVLHQMMYISSPNPISPTNAVLLNNLYREIAFSDAILNASPSSSLLALHNALERTRATEAELKALVVKLAEEIKITVAIRNSWTALADKNNNDALEEARSLIKILKKFQPDSAQLPGDLQTKIKAFKDVINVNKNMLKAAETPLVILEAIPNNIAIARAALAASTFDAERSAIVALQKMLNDRLATIDDQLSALRRKQEALSTSAFVKETNEYKSMMKDGVAFITFHNNLLRSPRTTLSDLAALHAALPALEKDLKKLKSNVEKLEKKHVADEKKADALIATLTATINTYHEIKTAVQLLPPSPLSKSILAQAVEDRLNEANLLHASLINDKKKALDEAIISRINFLRILISSNLRPNLELQQESNQAKEAALQQCQDGNSLVDNIEEIYKENKLPANIKHSQYRNLLLNLEIEIQAAHQKIINAQPIMNPDKSSLETIKNNAARINHIVIKLNEMKADAEIDVAVATAATKHTPDADDINETISYTKLLLKNLLHSKQLDPEQKDHAKELLHQLDQLKIPSDGSNFDEITSEAHKIVCRVTLLVQKELNAFRERVTSEARDGSTSPAFAKDILLSIQQLDDEFRKFNDNVNNNGVFNARHLKQISDEIIKNVAHFESAFTPSTTVYHSNQTYFDLMQEDHREYVLQHAANAWSDPSRENPLRIPGYESVTVAASKDHNDRNNFSYDTKTKTASFNLQVMLQPATPTAAGATRPPAEKVNVAFVGRPRDESTEWKISRSQEKLLSWEKSFELWAQQMHDLRQYQQLVVEKRIDDLDALPSRNREQEKELAKLEKDLWDFEHNAIAVMVSDSATPSRHTINGTEVTATQKQVGMIKACLKQFDTVKFGDVVIVAHPDSPKTELIVPKMFEQPDNKKKTPTPGHGHGSGGPSP